MNYVIMRYSYAGKRDVFLRMGGGWTVEAPDAEIFYTLKDAVKAATAKGGEKVISNYGYGDQSVVWVKPER